MSTMGRGARGDHVRDVQARLTGLGLPIDPEEQGEFGPTTERAVREFQQRRRLMVDGLVGTDTWEELIEAGFALGDRVLYLRQPFFRGDDVRALQSRLNLLGFDTGRQDGIFGRRTDGAVRDFQRNVGMSDDGIVGPTTIEALRRLRPVAAGPGRAAVREAEALRSLSAPMQRAPIALDPGHGYSDPGATGPGGTTEAEANYLVAEAVAAELAARDANPFLLRSRWTDPSIPERASLANAMGSVLLVSFHMNSHADPAAEGVSAYYYGTAEWSSQAGQRLAELLLDELTSRLPLKDGRTHPKSIQLLRETRMPAVQLEPCFITNPREEALIRLPSFRADLARAFADAAERFFGLREAISAGAAARE